MSDYGITPLDFTNLSTYSLFERPSKVTVADFARPPRPGMRVAELLASLPKQLAGADFPELIARLAAAKKAGRPILVGMGAHVIKVGLNPILLDLMERGLIAALALNGAGIIHDAELALAGKTSEDVGAVLGSGAFGAARETGEFLNAAIIDAARRGVGLGQGVGEALLERGCPHNKLSLLASAARLNIPVTVHVAIGTDIIQNEPPRLPPLLPPGERTGRRSLPEPRFRGAPAGSLFEGPDRGAQFGA